MSAIRCRTYSGSELPADLTYVPCTAAAWDSWCRKHGAEFLLLTEPAGGDALADLPPTFERWFQLESLLEQYGTDATFAFVDADTMIRWDTPNLFDLAGEEFTAVRDWSSSWIHRSIKLFQPFFPGTTLDWWDYFNAGMVILNAKHLEVTRALIAFVLEHKRALQPIFHSWQAGDDQTPFNFLVKRLGIRVRYLDARFNMIHCVPISQELLLLESGTVPALPAELDAELAPSQLDFIEMGYVWHFTNVIRTRALVIAKVWSLIRAAYD